MNHTLHTLKMLNLTMEEVAQMNEYQLTQLLEYIKLIRPQ